MASRLLTIAAAALLVLAFALATISDGELPLAQALMQIDPNALASLHGLATAWLPDGAWDRVAVPILVRPVWMLPIMTGIVSGGLALSLRPRPTPTPRRRRN